MLYKYMKKLFVLIVLLFILLLPLHSLEGEADISFGFLGYSFASNVNNYNHYLFGRILNFVYQLDSGLGITASPFIFYFNIADFNNYSLTFVNLSLFYNFLNNVNSTLSLGPFVSVNAVDYNKPGFVEFRSGINFYVRNGFFLAELGYKYNKNNRHGFYVQIGLDLFIALGFFVNENDVTKYQREQTWR